MSTAPGGLRNSRVAQGLAFFVIFTILSTASFVLIGTEFSWGLVLQQAIVGAIAAVLYVVIMAVLARRRRASS